MQYSALDKAGSCPGPDTPAFTSGVVVKDPARQPVGEVRVREATPADAAAWNAFVYARPDGTFFHRIEWRDVLQRAFGHRPHYLVAERGGELVGVLPLAEVTSVLFAHALISTPFCVYGGILSTDPESAGAKQWSI